MKISELLSQESPMKQVYDNFDINNINLSEEEYKAKAMTVPIKDTNQLVDLDWRRRIIAHQNVIASANGVSGSGKSSFLSSACIRLGKICQSVLNTPYEPFRIENVYYEPEEMQERIRTDLKYGEILLRDEHLKGQAGMMSDLTTNFLTDAEQQLRKNQNSFFFASIEEEDHAHFFVFELKHIIPDPETGFPKSIVAMLKTPRYTNPKMLVWRGLVAMPFPPKEYWDAYDKRKDEHINKLKAQYGNTLAPVLIDAIKILNKRHDDLVKKTREGLFKPIKETLIMSIISEEIGTRKYTNAGYRALKDKIMDEITKEYLKYNEERLREIEDKKEKTQLGRKEIALLQIEEAKRIKEAKALAFKEKLEEDKKRNELKRKALELREQELKYAKELREAKKQKNQEEHEKKVELKKKELTDSPAKHFAEELV